MANLEILYHDMTIGILSSARYMGQAPIASTESFRIVFEGVVGRNTLGNIAIDDISIAPGVCPTAPQVWSPIGQKRFPTYILTSRLRPLALETVPLRTMSAGKCLEFYPKQVF